MINILVMSHGEFAEGICKSAEMIIGEQENLKTVIFNPGESLDTLVEKLKKAINEFDNIGTIAEIKRNKKKISLPKLEYKADILPISDFGKYKKSKINTILINKYKNRIIR